MSFYVWCELVCEGCAVTTSGQHTRSTIPRRAMKREAVDDYGWSFREGGKTYCAECAEKYPA